MSKIKISEANPYEDTIFLIRATVNDRMYEVDKLKRIYIILEEFEKVMKSRQEKNIVGLQNFPTGSEQ